MQLQNAQIQRTRHSLIYLLTLFPVPCQNNVTTASSDGVPAAKTSLSSSDHNDIDINHLLSPPPPSTPPPLQRFLSPVKRLQWSSSAVSWCLLSSRQSPWNFGVKILLAGAGARARAHSHNTQLPLKTWRGHWRLWWENYGTAEIGGRLVLVWSPFGCGQPIVMNGHFGLD